MIALVVCASRAQTQKVCSSEAHLLCCSSSWCWAAAGLPVWGWTVSAAGAPGLESWTARASVASLPEAEDPAEPIWCLPLLHQGGA